MNDRDLMRHLPDLQIIWDALVRRDAIPPKADAIVVGGCSDTGLSERTAELFHDGVSDLIVISGYKPEKLNITEADFLANRCMELGVPKESIVLEKEASNTGENILFSAEIVKRMKPNATRIVLIHKPFMSLRFLATAEAQWPLQQPAFYTTCQDISFEDYGKLRGLEALAWEMLGDFKRMDEYVEKGYQTEQVISKETRAAYRTLIDSGISTR